MASMGLRARQRRQEAAGFLSELAGLLERYPDLSLTYTTDDDGVHAYSRGLDRHFNLGFNTKPYSQMESARAHADVMLASK
jgi:hypothetical protein